MFREFEALHHLLAALFRLGTSNALMLLELGLLTEYLDEEHAGRLVEVLFKFALQFDQLLALRPQHVVVD